MRLVIALPYVWLATFFLLPFALVLAIAFGTNNPDAVPPVDLGVSLKNFTLLFTDDLYLAAWLGSLAHRRDLDAASPCCWAIPWPTPSPAPGRRCGRCC